MNNAEFISKNLTYCENGFYIFKILNSFYLTDNKQLERYEKELMYKLQIQRK